jgi:hypothetical protein
MTTPPRIIWLASYPKSGNTWLRFLLHHYMHGEVTDSDQVERRIPDLHVTDPQALKAAAAAADGPLLCKTHLALTAKHPLVEGTAGFVYILRHARDVLLSNLNYFRMTRGEQEDLSDADYARRFIQHMGQPEWRGMGMGSWTEHAASWLAGATTLPHVFVRYEAMKADPEAHLAHVVRFLGREPDPDRVAAAVAASSFDRMRDLEARERAEGKRRPVFSIHDASRGSDRQFMNRGQSGQSLAHLGDDVEAAFTDRFGDVLDLLGYGP